MSFSMQVKVAKSASSSSSLISVSSTGYNWHLESSTKMIFCMPVPYTVVLTTVRAHKWHKTMLTTSFQRTLVAFLWFSNNQGLAATDNMLFYLSIDIFIFGFLYDLITDRTNRNVNIRCNDISTLMAFRCAMIQTENLFAM